MRACANCGEENPGRPRFCSSCGAPLDQSARVGVEARKVVSVVFCDLTGSTRLVEGLDAESLSGVLRRFNAVMRGEIERHGGTVEKFIRDAVVAVFGLPSVHEDDALRAVRAAAGMCVAIGELNERLAAELDVELQVRIGVNTGEVVVGDPTGGQGFAVGATVNLAARLERLAAPGEILLGPDTYRLVRGCHRGDPETTGDQGVLRSGVAVSARRGRKPSADGAGGSHVATHRSRAPAGPPARCVRHRGVEPQVRADADRR